MRAAMARGERAGALAVHRQRVVEQVHAFGLGPQRVEGGRDRLHRHRHGVDQRDANRHGFSRP